LTQTVTGHCQLELFAVSGSSAIKKTGYYNTLSLVFLFYLPSVHVHFTATAVNDTR